MALVFQVTPSCIRAPMRLAGAQCTSSNFNAMRTALEQTLLSLPSCMMLTALPSARSPNSQLIRQPRLWIWIVTCRMYWLSTLVVRIPVPLTFRTLGRHGLIAMLLIANLVPIVVVAGMVTAGSLARQSDVRCGSSRRRYSQSGLLLRTFGRAALALKFVVIACFGCL